MTGNVRDGHMAHLFPHQLFFQTFKKALHFLEVCKGRDLFRYFRWQINQQNYIHDQFLTQVILDTELIHDFKKFIPNEIFIWF